MPIDQGGDPWAGTTYKGFAGGPPRPPEPAPARLRRGPSRRTLLIGGVAAALVLGIGFGFLARPKLAGGRASPPPAAQASQTAALAPPGAAQVPIAVNPPRAEAAPPRPQGKLETLPPELARAEQAPAKPHAAASAAIDASAAAPVISAPPPTAAVASPTAPPAPAVEPTTSLRAGFDCAGARPGAEQLVCADPELAAADRRLSRAYRRALRSGGVDPGDLRQEQRDWIAIREDAARHSRRALAEVYDQRIQELDQIAESGNSGPPDDDSGPP